MVARVQWPGSENAGLARRDAGVRRMRVKKVQDRPEARKTTTVGVSLKAKRNCAQRVARGLLVNTKTESMRADEVMPYQKGYQSALRQSATCSVARVVVSGRYVMRA
jgi:hypothetical protein